MERLTVRVKEGNRKDECFIPGNKNAIKKVEYICEGERWESEEYKGKAVDKLAEYEDLEEQNKLLKLPCAVGDIIWDIDFGRPCGYEVTGFSFGSLNDDDWEEEKVLDKVVVYYTNSNGSITGTFAVSEIGKSVFLIKEEAEAALKELERGKGE